MAFLNCLPDMSDFSFEEAERRVAFLGQINRERAKAKGLSVDEYLSRFILGVSEETRTKEEAIREKRRIELLRERDNAKNERIYR